MWYNKTCLYYSVGLTCWRERERERERKRERERERERASSSSNHDALQAKVGVKEGMDVVGGRGSVHRSTCSIAW